MTPLDTTDIETAEALWTIGKLAREDMPSVALNVLRNGSNDLTTASLAGLGRAEVDEAPELFVGMLRAMGRGRLTRNEACRMLVLQFCRSIVDGSCEPDSAAKAIGDILVACGERDHEFDAFIYAASELDSRPSEREHFLGEIVKEAKRVIASNAGAKLRATWDVK